MSHYWGVGLSGCRTIGVSDYRGCPNIDNTSDPSVEAVRIAVKLNLVTGTYNLQVRAVKFRSANTRICEICNEEDKDIEHFFPGCINLTMCQSTIFKSISGYTAGNIF